MKKKIYTSLIATLLTFTTYTCAAEIKIGFLGTLSGPAAALGLDQYDGFMLALEQKNGQLGGVPVTVVAEDDQLKPDIGLQGLRRLIQREKVDIVTGVTFSNVMMAVAKPLKESDVLFVGSNAGPAPLAGPLCHANFFFTSFQNDSQAEVLGKYASDQGFKKMMLLAPNYQSGRDQVLGFKRYYNGEVVDEIYTQLNQLDYSAEISQIRAQNPDSIFVFFPGGMGVNFIKQMEQAGLLHKFPVLSVSTVDGTNLPAIQESALGVLAGAVWGPDLPGAANARFTAAFEKKYGRIATQWAAQAYDSAMLIDSALAATKGSAGDKAAFRAALAAANFESVRGNFEFGRNGFPIQDLHVFEVDKDDKGRVSLKTVATPLPAFQDAYVSDCPAT